jgi:hypothetical protein
VKVTRKDPFTGKTNTLELPITQAQLDQWRIGGRNIQDVMRHLDDNQREFLMTGIMPDSWEDIFKDSETAERGTGT